MIKTKVALLEGRLLFSQSELFENVSNCFEWLDKSRPSKKAFCFDHVNRINIVKSLFMPSCDEISNQYSIF